MTRLTQILRIPSTPPSPPGDPTLPTIYNPPDIDPDYVNWNDYYPANFTELQNLTNGTTPITRPAVIYLDNIQYDIDPSWEITEAVNGTDGDWLYIMSLNISNMSPEKTRYGSGLTNAKANTREDDNAQAPLLMLRTDLNTGNRVRITDNVHQVRFVGLRVTSTGLTGGVVRGLIEAGKQSGGVKFSDPSQLPSEIIFDRCSAHGPDGTSNASLWNTYQGDGFVLQANKVAIIDSDVRWIRGVGGSYGVGIETHAIFIPWVCDGITIRNSYIEGQGMSIFTGGDDMPIGFQDIQLTNIYIAENYLAKDRLWDDTSPSWNGANYGGPQKNWIELKQGQFVLIENNFMEDHYTDTDPQGRAITCKATDQSNLNPWIKSTDVTVRYNEIREGSFAWSITHDFNSDNQNSGYENYLFEHNLWVCSSVPVNAPTNGKILSSLSGVGQIEWNSDAHIKLNNIRFRRNTVLGHLAEFQSRATAQQLTNLGYPHDPGRPWKIYDVIFEDNIMDHLGGMKAQGSSAGDVSMDRALENYTWTGNVVFGGDPIASAPTGSIILDSISDVGFDQLGAPETWDPYGSFEVIGTHANKGCDYNAVISRCTIARTGDRTGT